MALLLEALESIHSERVKKELKICSSIVSHAKWSSTIPVMIIEAEMCLVLLAKPNLFPVLYCESKYLLLFFFILLNLSKYHTL